MTRASRGPALVMVLGAVLFLIAVIHHAFELTAITWELGPIIAVLLDGLPTIVIMIAGYWLAHSDLEQGAQWTVASWTVYGALGFVGLMVATLLIQMAEGETFREPLFILLVSADTGAIGGFVAGYFYSRAAEDAHRAEQASEALGFVNSVIRHDLRNDLTVIQGHAHKIEHGSDVNESAAVITRKSQEALSRIEDTRAIVRTLLGDADVETVDLTEIVAETVARFEDGVQIDLDLPAAAEVSGDLGLRSVVDNLVENAVEHNDASTPRIGIDVEVGDDAVRLTVEDNGPGIPDGRKASVFEPRGDGPGDGGLHLVKTLVEGYDGSIWVEDNEPRGSVFVVELPRETAP